MTNTPETDKLRDDIWKKPEVGGSDFAQMFKHSRKLERERDEAREQRDRYKLACDKYSEDEMTNSLQSLKQERDGWKAAYDNQVKLKRIISERPDLKERAEH